MAGTPIIVGVDPGGTTGISLWDGGPALGWFGQYPAIDAVDRIWNLIEQHKFGRGVHIACERFDITVQTARKTRQYDALYVTGALLYNVEITNRYSDPINKFIHYARSDAKTFAFDDRLKQIGWWSRGQTHINDATRQVLMHLAEIQPEVLKQILTRR